MQNTEGELSKISPLRAWDQPRGVGLQPLQRSTMTDTGSPSRPAVPTRTVAPGSAFYQHLLRRIHGLGLPYGREDSFKLSQRQIIQDRVLIGINRADLPAQAMFEIAHELGMPGPCRELLAPHTPQANVVLFGIEDRADGSVCKLYLEFWDQVKQEVRRTGARTPLLLHLGVKWDSARPGQHEVARYTCYPLLPVRDILRRMAMVYPRDGSPSTSEAALGIVRQGVKRNPAASFLYLEVGESDNPRCSFDVNLYKTGLSVADAAPELRQAAGHFGIAAEAIDAQLQRLGHCPLGHLSAGTDRHGGEFLSVYGEIRPL